MCSLITMSYPISEKPEAICLAEAAERSQDLAAEQTAGTEKSPVSAGDSGRAGSEL